MSERRSAWQNGKKINEVGSGKGILQAEDDLITVINK